MESLALLRSSPYIDIASPLSQGCVQTNLIWYTLWFFRFCSLLGKFLAYAAAAALLQQDHNLRLIGLCIVPPPVVSYPVCYFYKQCSWVWAFGLLYQFRLTLFGSKDAGFHCQPHPSSTSCKLSISQGMKAFPKQECQRHSPFLKKNHFSWKKKKFSWKFRQFFLKEKDFSICCLLFSISRALKWLFWQLSKFIVVSWGDKLPVSSLHHRQVSPNVF